MSESVAQTNVIPIKKPRKIRKDKNLASLEKRLGYTFKDKRWITEALTHASANGAKTPDRAKRNYQSMEYVGDAVLELAARQIAYSYFDLPPAGLMEVTKGIITNNSLTHIAKKLKIRESVIGALNLNVSDAMLADMMEAVLAAIHIDGGFEEAQKVIVNVVTRT